MKYLWSADKFFLNFGMIFLTKICSFSGSQRFSESTRDCKFRFRSAFPPWRRKLAENSDGETFIFTNCLFEKTTADWEKTSQVSSGTAISSLLKSNSFQNKIYWQSKRQNSGCKHSLFRFCFITAERDSSERPSMLILCLEKTKQSSLELLELVISISFITN